MAQIEVTSDVVVDVPPDRAFDFVADWTNNPRWQKGMRSCRWTSEPPLRVGSTYDQEASFLGRKIASSFKVVAHEPGRSLTITTTAGSFPITVTRSVEPTADGRSRVSARVSGDSSGFFRIAAPLLRGMVRRSVRGDYARLKVLLEQGTDDNS